MQRALHVLRKIMADVTTRCCQNMAIATSVSMSNIISCISPCVRLCLGECNYPVEKSLPSFCAMHIVVSCVRDGVRIFQFR